MIQWQSLIKIDAKTQDLEEYSEIREGPAKPNLINGVIFSKKSGKGYNIIIQTDTPTLEDITKVRVFCNCDDFKFRWAYVLHKFDALLAPQNFVLTPPKITNKTQEIGCCKHLKVFITRKRSGKIQNINMDKGFI